MTTPGGQWTPPPHPGPFPHHQPAPIGPPWAPGPLPSRNRGPLIIGGALILAAAIVATSVVLTRHGSSSTPAPTAPITDTTQTSSAPTTSATTASALAGPTYQVVPQSALPALGDIARLTGVDMVTVSELMQVPSPDATTTPPSCAFASNSASQSTWKSARAMAGLRFIDGTMTNYISTAVAGLAVFPTPADAASSLSLVSGSVRGCTSFTVPDWNPKVPPATWTIANVDHGDDHISWGTQQPDGWSCQRNYRIVGNLAANALICSDKARPGSAAALTDFVIAHATNQ